MQLGQPLRACQTRYGAPQTTTTAAPAHSQPRAQQRRGPASTIPTSSAAASTPISDLLSSPSPSARPAGSSSQLSPVRTARASSQVSAAENSTSYVVVLTKWPVTSVVADTPVQAAAMSWARRPPPISRAVIPASSTVRRPRERARQPQRPRSEPGRCCPSSGPGSGSAAAGRDSPSRDAGRPPGSRARRGGSRSASWSRPAGRRPRRRPPAAAGGRADPRTGHPVLSFGNRHAGTVPSPYDTSAAAGRHSGHVASSGSALTRPNGWSGRSGLATVRPAWTKQGVCYGPVQVQDEPAGRANPCAGRSIRIPLPPPGGQRASATTVRVPRTVALVAVAAAATVGPGEPRARDPGHAVGRQQWPGAIRPVLHGIDLESATIPDLQKAMDRGRLSSVELTRFYLTPDPRARPEGQRGPRGQPRRAGDRRGQRPAAAPARRALAAGGHPGPAQGQHRDQGRAADDRRLVRAAGQPGRARTRSSAAKLRWPAP